jgi:hypothetical protein
MTDTCGYGFPAIATVVAGSMDITRDVADGIGHMPVTISVTTSITIAIGIVIGAKKNRLAS